MKFRSLSEKKRFIKQLKKLQFKDADNDVFTLLFKRYSVVEIPVSSNNKYKQLKRIKKSLNLSKLEWKALLKKHKGNPRAMKPIFTSMNFEWKQAAVPIVFSGCL